MNDQQLAECIERILPDYMVRHGDEKGGPYYLFMEPATARRIVRDPRVAMAMLKKALIKAAHTKGLKIQDIISRAIDLMETLDDFERAINLACVEVPASCDHSRKSSGEYYAVCKKCGVRPND